VPDCEQCEVLRREMLRKDLVSLLYRVHFERASPAARSVALKQLNAAELELKMAEDALVLHEHEHRVNTIKAEFLMSFGLRAGSS
jgi:hypothetical protein